MAIAAAKAIVHCLEEEGVSVVFGLPGAAICPFYDALSHSHIRHILVRQEQNAAHAASGYARMTKTPGVCIATSGPGALNLITGIATAYMDSVPLVVITGQVESRLLGRDVFQEADITGSCEPFVKHSYLVKNANEIPNIFKEAFHIASTGRQGPVLIDIPVDIQREKIEYSYPDKVNIRSYNPNLTGHPGQIKRVANALKRAERPLICVGGGVFSANAEDALYALSQNTGIPVVTTMMGIGAISPAYEKNMGMIGMHGSPIANQCMNSADLVVLIGARVGDRAIMAPMGLSHSATIIHIDIDPAEIGKNIKTDIPLVGDARLILEQLNEKLADVHFEDWTEEIQEKSKPAPRSSTASLNPRSVMKALCSQMASDGVLVADVGQNQIWTARGYQIHKGRFLTSGGMGTMGYALPAAYGAKLACPKRQVVAICGDGSFQMQMMELATVRQNQIPVKIIIMNNGCLGMVRELQERQYAGNEMAVSLDGNPDFVKLSEAYQIPALYLNSEEKLEETIRKFLEMDGPCLLECQIASNEATL